MKPRARACACSVRLAVCAVRCALAHGKVDGTTSLLRRWLAAGREKYSNDRTFKKLVRKVQDEQYRRAVAAGLQVIKPQPQSIWDSLWNG